MNMKKIIIILVALVASGMIYVGVDRYRGQESDNVKIQKKWNPGKDLKKMGKDAKKGVEDIGNVVVNDIIYTGEDFASCRGNNDCDSKLCKDSTCRTCVRSEETRKKCLNRIGLPDLDHENLEKSNNHCSECCPGGSVINDHLKVSSDGFDMRNALLNDGKACKNR